MTEVTEGEVVETPVAGETVTAPIASPPAPMKKGNGCWKWGCGCLGVAAVLLVVLGIVVALAGKSLVESPEFKKALEEAAQQQNVNLFPTPTGYEMMDEGVDGI